MSRGQFLKTVAGTFAALAGASVSGACSDSAPPGNGGGNGGGNGNYPQGLTPSGTIFFDTRTSLQSVSNTSQMQALFQSASGSLAQNWDGTGRQAIRCTRRATCAEAASQIVLFNDDNLPTGADYYIQWRHRFGKHPNDPSGVGADNLFNIDDGRGTCGDNLVGCKILYFDELGWNSRHDIHWFNTGVRYQWVAGANHSSDSGIGASWNFNNVGGEEHVLTYAFRFTGSGFMRFYVDGVLNAQIDPIDYSAWSGARAIRLHNVWDQVPYDQTDYVWDIVVWAP